VHDEGRLRRLPRFPVARWVEHPFEWEAPRRYASHREYFWSLLGLFPFRTFRGGVELLPTGGGGTEVVAFAEITPRHVAGLLLTRFVIGPRNVRAVIRQCRAFERYLLGQAPSPFPQLAPQAPASAVPAVAGPLPGRAGGDGTPPPGETTRDGEAARATPFGAVGWRALEQAGLAPELVARLRRHLQEAPDEEVLEMRPFELADRWQTDRRDTLTLFLHATTAGLLEMHWSVLCPNCRLPNATYRSLPELEGSAHCDYCNIRFDAGLDRQVEVRFSAAEAIRHVEDRRFCSGGPMNTPHVVAQTTLAPGQQREVGIQLAPGAYRLRSPQCQTTAVLEAEGEPSAVGSAPLFALATDAIRPPLASTAAGETTFHIKSALGVPALVILERPDWPDTAATAAVVGTMQAFRDLFGSEVLAPGLQLAIQRLAFLFTDLTGSTALYQAVGQTRAFRLVQDHFRILRASVTAHEGAVVKTIGDAVMATFPTGAQALAAALAMQRDIRQLDTGGAVDPGRLLKIGIHEGPCIAVGANGRLDYFGTTVNIAARVEHESGGGEVVVTDTVFQDPVVQQRLRADGLTVTDAETRLRGVREPVKLHRLVPLAPTGSAAGVLK
jgi:class 3 adenylate cyclase